MVSVINKKEIAEVLYCTSILEKKVSRAYENLAEEVDDQIIKKLLLSISTDGQKHSLMLSVLSESVARIKIDENVCESAMGEAWTKLKELAEKEVLTSTEAGPPKLKELVDKMSQFESFVGEEFYTQLNLQIVKLEAEEINLGIDFRSMIDWIIVDEDRHTKIMQMIYKRMAQIG